MKTENENANQTHSYIHGTFSFWDSEINILAKLS